MRVAVITPYYQTPYEWICRCVSSVREQTFPCTHIIVTDGDGDFPQDLRRSDMQIIALPVCHGNYGDTPRAIGSISAFAQGFQAVAWLDSDNWYKPQHVESLLALAGETGARVCLSGRDLYALDGSLLGPCPEVESGRLFDTNCYLLFNEALPLVSTWWTMPDAGHVLGDRVLQKVLIESGFPHARSRFNSLCYRTHFKVHYEHFGKKPPPNARDRYLIK